MTIARRLAALEVALQPDSLGIRHFVTVDGGLTYLENTPAPRPSPTMAAPLDYRLALVGCGGTLPEGAATIDAAELADIEREGWTCIVIQYVDMSGGQYGPADNTAEVATPKFWLLPDDAPNT
jgi:hypothetical protein